MKIWIPMLVLFLSVLGLCIWDGIHTKNVLNHVEKESEYIYSTLLDSDISTDETLQDKIIDLNNYWTKHMDILCISISRKDMQPISDYMQYLHSSIINKNQEDAITYSRLLFYNASGLNETTGVSIINFL